MLYRRREREAPRAVEAFPGENVVAIEDLEETRHTTHLFLNLLLQILLFHEARRHLRLLSSLCSFHTARLSLTHTHTHTLLTEIINVTFGF